jgi:hypothetical protein
MSKQLYEEAIADLKKVKEIAEDNAKRAVVEAVAPRIRELIEKELLGESLNKDESSEDEDEEKKDKILIDEPTHDEKKTSVESVSFSEVVTGVKEEIENDATLDELVSNLMSISTPNNVNELNQKLRYVEKVIETLTAIKCNIKESKTFSKDISQLGDIIATVYGYIQEHVENPTVRLGYSLKIRKCLEKLKKLQETKMKRNLLGEEKVTIELDLPGIELGDALQNAMVELVLDDDEDEDEDFGDEPSDADDEPSDEEPSDADDEPSDDEGLLETSDNAVVEIDEGMLRREIAFMKLLRESDSYMDETVTDETNPEERGMAGTAASSNMSTGASTYSDDEEDELLELDMDNQLDEGEWGEDTSGGYHDKQDAEEAAEEARIERERKAARKPEYKPHDPDHRGSMNSPSGPSKNPDGSKRGLPKKKLSPTSSADRIDKEAEEDQEAAKKAEPAKKGWFNKIRSKMGLEEVRMQMTNELKLQESLRKRASELKKLYESYKVATSRAKTLLERKDATTNSSKLKAAYAVTAQRYNRSVTHFNKLSESLSKGTVKNSTRSNNVAKPDASAGSDMLRKKLAETNLFNAKLLFTNKILQTESLTARQKAQVIEQLDGAETIREAKLVYESLAKALVKPRRTVSEGRVLGSSSQATRAASTQTPSLNEGLEAERWARLAGIK